MLYQYYTRIMTMKTEGLSQLALENFVEISRKDADNIGISDWETLRVSSKRGEIKVKARISGKTFAGTVSIPFHYSEGASNVLMNNTLDPVAKIPEFKGCAVKLAKAA
jgi:predicted molibdopterin-dependent oxidoreductase YjgC